MRIGQVGSWAEVAKIYRCWCWPVGAAWIHEMGVVCLSGLGGFSWIIWGGGVLSKGVGIDQCWWIGGVAWFHELGVFFLGLMGASGGSPCRRLVFGMVGIN